MPSLRFYLDEYAQLSASAREHHEVRTEVRYGPHPGETLDFFPGTPGGPVPIFVHRRNWQELTKDSSAFAAPEILRSGAAFAVVNYGPAPAFPLDEIVAMIRRSVWWLHSQASELRFDPGRRQPRTRR